MSGPDDRDRRTVRWLRRGGESGATLAEFTMVIPLLLLLVVGIFDVGRLVYINNALAEAAREGARWGAVQGRAASDKPGIVDYVEDRLAAVPGAVVTVACEALRSKAGVCTSGDIVAVQVTAGVSPVTPIISQFVGDITLSSTARMTIHQ